MRATEEHLNCFEFVANFKAVHECAVLPSLNSGELRGATNTLIHPSIYIVPCGKTATSFGLGYVKK